MESISIFFILTTLNIKWKVQNISFIVMHILLIPL
jgi:hypothetical protein